jgi:acyl-Coa thioesterase superfamily protein/acyl-CoA thioesterase superfamily protein
MFSAVTAIVPHGENRFAVDVSESWTIAGKPNGGYLLAMLGRVAVAATAQPHVVAASATYLRPPQPGAGIITATVLRSGRTASQCRSQLWQGDELCVEALVTVSELADAPMFWGGGVPQPQIAERERCVRVPSASPTGLRVPIMAEVDLRIDPADLGFASGAPSGRGELRGWLELPAGEQFDPVALLYAVDAFPPATFEVAATGWVPTLELTAYVRALPAPGPVRVLHKAQLIAGQRVDEATFVWDTTGRLVAQGLQLAGIRVG